MRLRGGDATTFAEPTRLCTDIEAFELPCSMVGEGISKSTARTVCEAVLRARATAACGLHQSRGDLAGAAGWRICADRFGEVSVGEEHIDGG